MSELVVESVFHSYGHANILNGVFLRCKPTEIIALMGRNGSGKSTLLQIILGATTPDFCFMKLDGEIIRSFRQRKRKISLLPQQNYIPFDMTLNQAMQCLCPPQSIQQIRSDQYVHPRLNTKFGDFSGGERRYIEILLTLNTASKYILLDEPFNEIAPIMKQAIKKLITEKAAEKSIILADHDYRSVLEIANRITLLSNGTLREVTSREELSRFGYLTE